MEKLKSILSVGLLVLIAAVFVLFIESQNYEGIVHYEEPNRTQFALVYFFVYFLYFILLLPLILNKGRKSTFSKILIAISLLLFPTIRSEKYSFTHFTGESLEEYLPIHDPHFISIDSDKYFRLGTYISCLHDLFTEKNCTMVYERGHKKGMQYCEREYTLKHFINLGNSLHFLVYLYSVLITTVLLWFLYRQKVKSNVPINATPA